MVSSGLESGDGLTGSCSVERESDGGLPGQRSGDRVMTTLWADEGDEGASCGNHRFYIVFVKLSSVEFVLGFFLQSLLATFYLLYIFSFSFLLGTDKRVYVEFFPVEMEYLLLITSSIYF